jgi:hypothetical protein
MMANAPTAEQLRDRVLDAARREPSPPRRVKARRGAALIALGFGVAAPIGLVKWLLSEPHHPHWRVVQEGDTWGASGPLGYVVTLEAAWLLVALVATWAGFARGRSMLGRSGVSKIAVAALTPVALAATWLAVAFAWLQALLPLAWLEVMNDTAQAGAHTNCAIMSVVYAAGPLVAFFALRRSRDPMNPRLSGAAIGAIAGAWGAVVHFPFCQCTSPLHVALGHVLPVAVLAALGAIAGDRVLGIRATALSPAR